MIRRVVVEGLPAFRRCMLHTLCFNGELSDFLRDDHRKVTKVEGLVRDVVVVRFVSPALFHSMVRGVSQSLQSHNLAPSHIASLPSKHSYHIRVNIS
jgi:uncharacterized protein YjhX (UPF0386 family)